MACAEQKTQATNLTRHPENIPQMSAAWGVARLLQLFQLSAAELCYVTHTHPHTHTHTQTHTCRKRHPHERRLRICGLEIAEQQQRL